MPNKSNKIPLLVIIASILFIAAWATCVIPSITLKVATPEPASTPLSMKIEPDASGGWKVAPESSSGGERLQVQVFESKNWMESNQTYVTFMLGMLSVYVTIVIQQKQARANKEQSDSQKVYNDAQRAYNETQLAFAAKQEERAQAMFLHAIKQEERAYENDVRRAYSEFLAAMDILRYVLQNLLLNASRNDTEGSSFNSAVQNVSTALQQVHMLDTKGDQRIAASACFGAAPAEDIWNKPPLRDELVPVGLQTRDAIRQILFSMEANRHALCTLLYRDRPGFTSALRAGVSTLTNGQHITLTPEQCLQALKYYTNPKMTPADCPEFLKPKP